jgi:DNA helicase II / ATP-dependent DNA helicase PcrA
MIYDNLSELTKKRELLKTTLLEQHKKIFQIENELIQIEKNLANFSDDLILENLKLSEQQELIVNATEDNILVVACPGSGKTHTLISRYVKLILDNQTTPDETLLITFTKKAGLEMLNRLSSVLPHKIPYHVGSLHGLGYKVLQEYNNINYTVLDEKDVKDYLIDLILDYQTLQKIDEDVLQLIKNNIQLIINQASTTYPFNMKSVLKKNNLEKYYKDFNCFYKLYQQRKNKENLVDFNDLMIQFSKFLDDPKSDLFKSKIKYVFFDEYQDVNPVQNYILLKLYEKSKIMVVGDDAQAIYAFRGSSVKYILNFNQTFNDPNKTKSMYLLAENYRSTPSIVNFCQDIISHNTNQFAKSVVSKQNKVGFKPCVFAFKNQIEQYKWVVNDIIEKNNKGVKFSDMVILSRKNNLLDEVELHLMGNKIPTVKHIGLSLLDKPHIKDFLAWITILINPKSSIHWKRIISLHPEYCITRANEILDYGSNIMNSLKDHIDKEKSQDPSYTGISYLYESIQHLKTVKKDIDKARYIINYLEKLWILKKDSNIEGKINDIYNLLNYLKNSSLEQFIIDLYLNQEVETNLENILYLTTIHGAKGLEWEYVYIIDVDSKNFSLLRPKYYLDELEEVDEERRLLYVAASRAKKYLFITSYQDINSYYKVMISPLIREIDQELYNSCNLTMAKIQPTLLINRDVHNYLRFIGYSKISDQLYPLVNTRGSVNKPFDIPGHIEKLPNKAVIGNFIDCLIGKMLQVNYPTKIKKFGLNLAHGDANLPQKVYLEYVDTQTDWRNILEYIYFISVYKISKSIDLSSYHDLLVSQTAFNYYIELEKGICKIINGLKPKEIHTHYTVSIGSVKGEVSVLCDDTLIEIISYVSKYNELVTVSNLAQTLLYGYLLKKKEHKVNKIILYNPLNGEVNNLDVSNFNWIKFKKIIYND